MTSLRFTADGVVGAPTTLQIRIGASGPGRIRVGAPAPSRCLTVDEVLDNVRAFREPGPRKAPVDSVVLSVLPDAWSFAACADLVEEGPGHAHGDGEADALTLAVDGGVDADDAALHVEERPP